jgi:hypothetical protein
MVKHTFEKLVLLYINVIIFVIITFDLRMSKGALDNFSFMINFLTLDWESKHITIALFEAKCIIRINLVNQLQVLFERNRLISKIICYVKDKGMFTLTNVLKQMLVMKD